MQDSDCEGLNSILSLLLKISSFEHILRFVLCAFCLDDSRNINSRTFYMNLIIFLVVNDGIIAMFERKNIVLKKIVLQSKYKVNAT